MLRRPGSAITKTPEPERAQVKFAAPTSHEVGHDLADRWCDPKSVTTHSGCDHQAGQLIDSVKDRERVGRAVNCPSPRH
jgi:hypothetical protein